MRLSLWVICVILNLIFYPDNALAYMNLTSKQLLDKTVEIWGKQKVAQTLGYKHHSEISKWFKSEREPGLNSEQRHLLEGLIPAIPPQKESSFKFIDLFAGIGGIRRGFEEIAESAFSPVNGTSTQYKLTKANYYNDPKAPQFNSDIREVTLSETHPELDETVEAFVDHNIPDHDVLLAGFPCQPFSLAGVSKKNALGRAHGFECKTHGHLIL